ncbi:P-loop containing nucleoside triphosphate hydrolase protein [Mycena metata]|uniref:P-loop containing nucleoside triphosphate hydrolase protein n=1 Tax=Mycena metata TaxID=1033252 RepID=A0AAD7MTD7_9AGAR|nr:P-loop containing nucleoside triphosphate hydrolase protein [Mycena metata]
MATVDATHLSGSQYAANRKELLGLMSQLRAVGAQGELDLPRIAVIGNQSAGKSSVVEAISGIKVPRDAGTCTRCPMECRLSSSSNSWSCRISIRLEFDPSGRPRPEVLERVFGDMIINKDEVEIGLRRAQFAVLNPSVSFEEILAMNAEEIKNGISGLIPLPFSRNVVCVDLEGPELTDLMFLDLPGIIANAEQEIIDLVEEMVVSNIRGNCLILVALPMTDDIENQRALRLARQEDPAGRRTIGVLTKPDMLSVGSKVRDLWLDVIEGRNHILMHGYFCTRQPDDDERAKNITPAQARRTETTFFAETAPWSKTKHKERFGTENLVSSLSTILVQIINDRLPLIRSMANERMDACRRELGSLPAKVVGEPATHVLNLITAFCSEIGVFVEGQSDKSDLIHERNTAFAEFKRSIHKTQPQFSACTVAQAGTPFFPIQIDNKTRESATDLIVSQKTFIHSAYAMITSCLHRSITRELPGNIPFSAKKTLITSFQHTWLACARDCFNVVKQSMLALLMRCIDEKFGRYELLQTRLKTCITNLAAKYFESCANFLLAMLEVEQVPFTQNSQYLQASTEKWLSRYKEERAAKKESNEEAGKRRKLGGAQPSASASRDAELCKFDLIKFDTPASSSAGLFAVKPPVAAVLPDPTRSFSSGLSTPKPQADGSSSSPRPASPSNTARTDAEKINGVLAQLAELGYPGIVSEDLGKLRQVDEFETEITVMSEVRGYFECAYKRVIDNIPALIDAKFLRAMAQNLQQELISEFSLGSENANAVCAAFLVEDPRLVAKREDLMARNRRLEAVQIQLHNFGLNRTAGQP